MNIDLWVSIATIAAALFSFISCILTFSIFRSTRKKKISCNSKLKLIDNKAAACLYVKNAGMADVVIEKIAFPLTIWDDSPRLNVHGFMKLLRIKDILCNSSSITHVSDFVVKYKTAEAPVRLREDEYCYAEIFLDDMMEAFVDRNESFGSKLFFIFFVLFMTVDVSMANGVYKFRAHREIRYYLWNRYKHDHRLFRW